MTLTVKPTSNPPNHPQRLIIETTTYCDMQCLMCPRFQGIGSQSHILLNTIYSLTEAMSNVQSVVLSGIGEPMLHPQIYEIVKICKTHTPPSASIGFQSNGNLIDKKALTKLINAGLNKLCISLHHLDSPDFETSHKQALMHLKALISDFRGYAQFGVQIVLTRHNIFHIAEVLRDLNLIGMSFVILSHLLPYHAQSLQDCAYDINTQKAVQIYRKWLKVAEKNGIDIKRYFEALRKFIHDEHDKRLLQLVKDMKDEASAQGVNLFLNHLLSRDEEFFSKAEAEIERIKDTAKVSALEVTVPAIYPSNIRVCEFVENSAVFVNVDGKVSPCYYLWHDFSCYIGGLKKEVKSWFLGSLTESSLTEICRQEDFKAFRSEVMQYRFPFCYDCSFALCNLVESADFENDCYLSPVPCGACLWCTGLFHCMF